MLLQDLYLWLSLPQARWHSMWVALERALLGSFYEPFLNNHIEFLDHLTCQLINLFLKVQSKMIIPSRYLTGPPTCCQKPPMPRQASSNISFLVREFLISTLNGYIFLLLFLVCIEKYFFSTFDVHGFLF